MTTPKILLANPALMWRQSFLLALRTFVPGLVGWVLACGLVFGGMYVLVNEAPEAAAKISELSDGFVVVFAVIGFYIAAFLLMGMQSYNLKVWQKGPRPLLDAVSAAAKGSGRAWLNTLVLTIPVVLYLGIRHIASVIVHTELGDRFVMVMLWPVVDVLEVILLLCLFLRFQFYLLEIATTQENSIFCLRESVRHMRGNQVLVLVAQLPAALAFAVLTKINMDFVASVEKLDPMPVALVMSLLGVFVLNWHSAAVAIAYDDICQDEVGN